MKQKELTEDMKVSFTGKDKYDWGDIPREECYGIIKEFYLDTLPLVEVHSIKNDEFHPMFTEQGTNFVNAFRVEWIKEFK